MAEDNKTDNNNKIYKKWWFWVIIVLVIVGIGAGAGTTKNNNDNSNSDSNNVSYNDETKKKENDNLKLGETFTFDNLEITLGTTITYKTLENQFSDHNGETVVELPITTKNLKEESHNLNLYSYKVFGPKGTEIDKPSTYFMDNSIDFGGELRPGASITKNIYFYYDGDGEYVIEFGFLKTEKTVKFEIKK